MKLGEVCTIIMGQAPSGDTYNDAGEGFPLLAGASDLGTRTPAPKRYTTAPSKICEQGDLILCIRATIGDKNWANKKYCLGRGVAALRPKNENELTRSFLWHWLSANEMELKSKGKGATFLQVTKKDIEDLTISIPNIETQNKITTALDLIDNLLRKRQEQIDLLDTLVKSRFVEMFGDPMLSNSQWPLSKLGAKFTITSGGTPSTSEPSYWEGGNIPWIGSNMCQDVVLYRNDGKFITQAGLDNSSAKIFTSGTVLVALVGATIGKTALLRFSTATNQNIAAIDVNSNKDFYSEYIFYHIQALYDKFMEIGEGKFKMANQAFIKNLPLPCPPISVQEKFVIVVNQINKSKLALTQSLAELDTLKKALMQKFFW